MKYRHIPTNSVYELDRKGELFMYGSFKVPSSIVLNTSSCDWELIIEDDYPIGTKVINILEYKGPTYTKMANGRWKASTDYEYYIYSNEIGKDKRFQIVVEEKKKTPIFTTEDGKELVVGDRYYTVFIPNLVQSYNAKVHKTEDFDNINYKYFSTEKAVNEYIIKHSKILSLKDICKSKGGDIEKSMLYIDLKKLVEERIKNK